MALFVGIVVIAIFVGAIVAPISAILAAIAGEAEDQED